MCDPGSTRGVGAKHARWVWRCQLCAAVLMLKLPGAEATKAPSSLTDAIYDGDAPAVAERRAEGKEVDWAVRRGKGNLSPLHHAATHGHPAIAELLLRSRGVEVNLLDVDGGTPLLCAADYGQTEVAKLLLEAGADANRADNDGITPLLLAACYGHLELAKDLCAHGAVRSGRELVEARRYGHTELAHWLEETGGSSSENPKLISDEQASKLLLTGTDMQSEQSRAIAHSRLKWGLDPVDHFTAGCPGRNTKEQQRRMGNVIYGKLTEYLEDSKEALKKVREEGAPNEEGGKGGAL